MKSACKPRITDSDLRQGKSMLAGGGRGGHPDEVGEQPGDIMPSQGGS